MNANVAYRKRKTELLDLLDKIDKNVEIRGLYARGRELQRELRKELKDLLKLEEVKWLQRYKDK